MRGPFNLVVLTGYIYRESCSLSTFSWARPNEEQLTILYSWPNWRFDYLQEYKLFSHMLLQVCMITLSRVSVHVIPTYLVCMVILSHIRQLARMFNDSSVEFTRLFMKRGVYRVVILEHLLLFKAQDICLCN